MSTSGSRPGGQDRPVPLTRWQDWVGAASVTLIAAGLVAVDLSDTRFRHWWAARPLTTSTVAGLLVLLITLLVADQVVRMRQIRERSRAVAAQAAILVAQASRTARAVSSALDGSGDRGAASDELRTYMIMLLVGAPVLIDARLPRNFLEQAQHLAAEMARLMAAPAKDAGTPAKGAGTPAQPRERLDEAVRRLRAASAPLLRQLSTEQLAAAGDEPS
jgi:hypothetical protein